LEPNNEFPHLAACGSLDGLLRMVELPNVLGLLNVLGKCGLGDVKPLRLSSDVQRPAYFDEVP
jgi:hypothetical protein